MKKPKTRTLQSKVTEAEKAAFEALCNKKEWSVSERLRALVLRDLKDGHQ